MPGAMGCTDVNGLKQALLAGKRGAALPAAPVAQQKRAARCIARASGLDKKKINKVVLAYSGGLDTSVILKWLQETYDCEVVTFTADLGQGEELEPARKKAEAAGVKDIFIDDLREEFVSDYVFPMFRANSLYEGVYLLGTSIARPLIAKRQIEIAKQVGADAVSHGATGKGNDQVRFELGYYGLKPDIKVISPWREWDLNSRSKLIAYAESKGIAVPEGKRGEPPFSTDANLLHISYEGNLLEDPWAEPTQDMFTRSVSPEQAPDKATYIEIDFEKGDPVAINGEKLSPATLLTNLNKVAGDNGIGRIDIVESRFVGMKSRGVYETPGGTILLTARRAVESITLDRGELHLKDELMPRYAELVYNGFWFSPERRALQAAIDETQQFCTGTVRLKLYKGNVIVVGRKSPYSLYDEKIASFEDDGGLYDQKDAAGFIKLQALRLRTLGANRGQ
ncbi:Argininosuccinate synthase [Coccomyxa sp. Obi]|nr:Argininosuccinate synthase [Coccomyxa sp. Obi]